jgi:hypothetical protein
MMDPLKVELEPKTDRDSKIWHLGKQKHPTILKLNKGVDFYIYLSDSEEGLNQIHIVSSSSNEYYDPRKYLSPRIIRSNNINSNLGIDLEKKSIDGIEFFHGTLKHDGVLDFNNGISFLVFTADEGSEQLQISIPEPTKTNKEKYTPKYVIS